MSNTLRVAKHMQRAIASDTDHHNNRGLFGLRLRLTTAKDPHNKADEHKSNQDAKTKQQVVPPQTERRNFIVQVVCVYLCEHANAHTFV
jgi:hypothetical protein